LTKKAPYKGLGADSEEKRELASDIDTAAVDSLKVLDPERPIREANSRHISGKLAEPTIPRLSRRIGALVSAFSPQECANYFRHAGYAST
jgi:hypothetical protein